MKVINKFLSESYPKNPDQIILENNYYPSGLTEKEIYEYYLKNKSQILDWIGKRNVAFFLKLENKMIVKRKTNKNEFIKLTKSNFDELITGRTIQIHVQHPQKTNYFIIDIDSDISTFRDIKIASKDVKKILEKPFGVRFFEFLFSGETGIHLIGYMNNLRNINQIRASIFSYLQKKQDKYFVNVKGERTKGINLDLSPNHKNALHLSRYSLTKEGLICDDIRENGGKKI